MKSSIQNIVNSTIQRSVPQLTHKPFYFSKGANVHLCSQKQLDFWRWNNFAYNLIYYFVFKVSVLLKWKHYNLSIFGIQQISILPTWNSYYLCLILFRIWIFKYFLQARVNFFILLNFISYFIHLKYFLCEITY